MCPLSMGCPRLATNLDLCDVVSTEAAQSGRVTEICRGSVMPLKSWSVARQLLGPVHETGSC